MVRIVAYESKYFDELASYRLDEVQSQFSRVPSEVFSDPKMMNEERFHYCILQNDAAVGFFTLDFSADRFDYSTNPNAVLLRSFSMNPAFQGKGIAKIALLQLPELVKKQFSNTNEIAFSVNARNLNAYHLYLKSGFLDSDRIYEGKKGPQYVMYKKLI